MMRVRFRELTILCVLTVAAACSRSQPTAVVGPKAGERRVVATFTGSYDPANGKLTITPDPESAPGALTVIDPTNDGSATYNPPDTFQIRTTATGTDDAGCDGGTRAFWGDIELRSFYRTQNMQTVYVEITDVTPSANFACNSVGPVAGISGTNTVWSYGTVGHVGTGSDIKSIRWAFREEANEGFLFHGSVWTTVTTEFDWTPAQVYGGRSFVETSDTTAHLRWDGTSWQDLMGTGISFQAVGAPTSTSTTVPGAPYASGFTSGNYWIADAAHGGNAVDTSGDFTVCAKFKPGQHPMDDLIDNTPKAIVAKGVPETTATVHEGWSLMQMHSAYCFHYRNEAMYADGIGENLRMSPLPLLAGTTPELYPYGYLCGGRNGFGIQSGMLEGFPGFTNLDPNYAVTPFANGGADLPLAIGANSNGSHPARDAGVYEVIFDRRGFTSAVASEIVNAAEGLVATVPGTLIPLNDTAQSNGTGLDGNTYLFPQNATIPLYDASGQGLMPEGAVRRYYRPLTQNTTATGFCIGAEVKANGAWSAVQGGVFQFGDAGAFGADFVTSIGAAGTWRITGGYLTASSQGAHSGWTDGSVRTIKVCYEPPYINDPFSHPGYLNLYSDGAGDGAAQGYPSLPNLSGGSYLYIGQNTVGGTTTQLSGARIQRVFVCPTYVAADCN